MHPELLQTLIDDQLGTELKDPWTSARVLTEADYISVDADDRGTK